ncbi:MAG: entericidin A/B family lipoprotein [Alphaproteobacteria bacterium]|nr:entericidin A/B family lipoprotein [Alphaproteobacteria bacterium]
MKKAILSLYFVVSVFALSGCETLEGAGRDISKAGDAIQDAAN